MANQTKTREIEARLELLNEGRLDVVSSAHHIPADLRYLLDRVRAQSERIEALEAAVRKHWQQDYEYEIWCAMCGYEVAHAADCIVLTILAPETVEMNE